MSGKKWTNEEENLLKKEYVTVLNKVLVKKLGRSINSIQKRAGILNLHKTPEFMREYLKTTIQMAYDAKVKRKMIKPWSKEDDNTLRKLCDGSLLISQIAKRIDRSWGSVHNRIRKLGLSTRNIPKLSGKEGEKLAELFFKEKKWEIIERGGNNKPFDFIVELNGKRYAIDVKHGSIVISRDTFMRFVALPYEHAIFYVTPEKRFFMLFVEEFLG